MEALAFNDFESSTSWNFRLKMFTDGSVQGLYSYNHSFGSGYKRSKPDALTVSAPDPVRSSKNSLTRTIQKVYELSKSNTFQYFVTFTFNDNFLSGLTDDYLYNYSVYSSVMAEFTHWLSVRSSRGTPARWIIVPELHKSGRYHFHGLISADFLDLSPARSPYTNRLLRDKVGHQIYNLHSFDWGYTTVTEITNPAATANYITKYFTKELRSSTRVDLLVPKGKKRYWASRNLATPSHVHLNLTVRDVAERFAVKSSYTKTLYPPVGKMSFFEFRADKAPQFADYCDLLSPQFNKIFILLTNLFGCDRIGLG